MNKYISAVNYSVDFFFRERSARTHWPRKTRTHRHTAAVATPPPPSHRDLLHWRELHVLPHMQRRTNPWFLQRKRSSNINWRKSSIIYITGGGTYTRTHKRVHAKTHSYCPFLSPQWEPLTLRMWALGDDVSGQKRRKEMMKKWLCRDVAAESLRGFSWSR